MKTEIRKVVPLPVTLTFIVLVYFFIAYASYLHGYDAGYHAIEIEANQN